MTLERIGPWKITGTLGSGGMGNVYLAEHVDNRSQAAVKVLTASLAREAGFVERFNREIDAMRKLSNPHIVRLFDSGVDGDDYYYAMEYVSGETLLALMRRERRLPWQRALEISIQVCQALKSAHDMGIIHRDLKPSNLLLTPEGSVKLTDFGVAQVFASQRLTVTGGIIGTAEYMSPEQAQGKRAGKQSDLYSLGAVMYAMITGRTPFSGSTAVEVIQKHKFGLFSRPALIVPDLPQKVDETICKLLEKEPAKRFPDALVLQRHLEQLLLLDDRTVVSAGITLADQSRAVASDSTTAAAPDSNQTASTPRPGPATLMQGLVRAELEDLDRGHWLSALFNNIYVLLTLLALVVGGGIWWLWPRTVAPDELFAKGERLMQDDPGPEWSRARREYFQPLLERDPERWHAKVDPYLRQIELYELTRSSRGSRREKSAVPDSDPERFLQLAQQYRRMGDSVRAEKTLAALQGFLTGSAEHERTRDLARQLLEDVRKERPDIAQQNGLLMEAHDRARQLAADGKLDQARDIWAGLIELYGDDPEALAFVALARGALAKMEPRGNAPDHPAGQTAQ